TDVVAGSTVSVTLTDSAGNTATGTATVGANGSYTTAVIDTSGLLDGTITTTVTATDNNGNPLTATDTDVKDAVGTIIARDDTDNIDLGELQVTNYPSINGSNLVILGALEGNDGANSSLGFTVNEGTSGSVNISVQQTALVAVADAVNIEVYNSSGDLVYVGTTGGDPLVGDVIGLELLGLTGNDTLTATISGLEPDDYTIVVRNDRSALETLVNNLSLAELGDAGVVLGPDNQAAVLNAVETALNGDYPVLQVGTAVRGVLEAALETTDNLGAGELVGILQGSPLLSTLLGGVIDPVLDAVADALLSNTLTLLETTDITATVTEFDYANNTAIEGNVIDPDALIPGEPGEDTVTANTVLIDIDSNNTQSEPTFDIVNGIKVFTIEGEYGVLVIDENGDYSYTANGNYVPPGATEEFEYTISNGVIDDTAKLTINISFMAPTPIVTDNVANDGSGGALIPAEIIADSGTTNDNTPSIEIAPNIISDGQTPQLVVDGIVVDAIVVKNSNGSYTLTPQTALEDGDHALSYNIKDAVDNVSGNAPVVTVKVDTTMPDALDDQASAGLDLTPVATNSTGGQSGTVSSLVSLGAVGDVVNVSLLSSSTAFTVDVATNTTQDLTISGTGSQALGLALGADKDFDVLVYRQAVGSNQAELVQAVPNWLDYKAGIAGVIGGTWTGLPLELDTFSGGAKYYIVVANGSGILNLGAGTSVTVKTDSTTLTDFDIDLVPSTGNVLTNDIDTGLSTVVTKVNGNTISELTTITGEYGSLAIDTNGQYTYTPKSNLNVIGKSDSFEYTIDNGNGNIDTATLIVTINGDGQATVANSNLAAARIISDDSMALSDDLTALGVEYSGTETLDLDFSSFVAIDALGDTTASINSDFMLSDVLQMDEGQYIDIATDDDGNTTLAFTGQETVETAMTVDSISNKSADNEVSTDTQMIDMTVDSSNLIASNDWDNLANIANASHII
ncbi:beta strand repeat-containing protein, partial [Psychrobacter alimentarius]|uniref:beta strand repeat-containing protein n=1 Tax=Psychrobacter alimentarius TaxID=261164 RepID=UPI001917FE04